MSKARPSASRVRRDDDHVLERRDALIRSQGGCDLADEELEGLPVIRRVGGEQEIAGAEFAERQQSLDALLGREEEEGDRQIRRELAPTCLQGSLVLGENRPECERLADLGGV